MIILSGWGRSLQLYRGERACNNHSYNTTVKFNFKLSGTFSAVASVCYCQQTPAVNMFKEQVCFK